MANRTINVTLKLVDEFSNKAGRIGKSIDDFGKNMKDAGGKMTAGITLPIVAMGTAVLKTAGDFEKGMNRVKALSGATGDEFKMLRDQAKKLGAETEFSASQAAEGMQYLAQSGFTVTQVMEAMPGVLDLAAAGQLELGVAADITANILNQFNKKASDSAQVADLIADAANTSSQSVEEFADAMNYLGPTARAMGISLEEAAAVAGIMANNGLKGSLGTRAFGTSLVRLAKPTNQALDLMDKLNLQFFDSKGNYKSLAGIVAELEGKFKGMNEKQKQAALGTLFGAEAIQEWNILLLGGSKKLKDYTADLKDSGGAASEVARIQREGLNGEMEKLTSSVEGLSIAFSESGLLGVITNIIIKITELVNWLATLDPTLMNVAAGVLAIAAVAGPVLIIIGNLITLVGGLWQGLLLVKGALFAATTGAAALGAGALLTIGAIVALTAVIGGVIYKLWELKNAQDAVAASERRRQSVLERSGFANEQQLHTQAGIARKLTPEQRKRVQATLDRSKRTGADKTQYAAELQQKEYFGKVVSKANGGMVSPIYAAGGMGAFSRRGTDSVPAILSPGEAVMSRDAVDKFARGQSGNTVVNIDLRGAVVSNEMLQTMVREVKRALGRDSELNTLGIR